MIVVCLVKPFWMLKEVQKQQYPWLSDYTCPKSVSARAATSREEKAVGMGALHGSKGRQLGY
eukprot:6193276-Pleurochrysis_carterae.AAC.1